MDRLVIRLFETEVAKVSAHDSGEMRFAGGPLGEGAF